MSTLTPLHSRFFTSGSQQAPPVALPLVANSSVSPLRPRPVTFDNDAPGRLPTNPEYQSQFNTALAEPPISRMAAPSVLATFRRLAGSIQSGLIGAPTLEPASVDIAGYQQRLTAFWAETEPGSNVPGSQIDPLTRQTWVAGKLEKQWQTAAKLQIITPEGRALVKQLFDPAAPLKPGIFQVHGPATTPGQQVELSGVFVISRSPDENAFSSAFPVLLALPGKGWIECPTGRDAKRRLQAILNAPLQRSLLLNQMPMQDRDFVLGLENELDLQTQGVWFDASPIKEPLFANRLKSVLAQQQLDIAFQAGQNRTQGISAASGLNELADLRKRLPAPDLLAAYQNPAADAFTALGIKLASGLPDLRAEARTYMREQVKTLTGQEVDPDNIWMHTFDTGVGSHTAFSGYMHSSRPVRSQTLTELALNNFSAEDLRAPPGAFDQNNGFYRVGPEHVGVYDTANELQLQPSALMSRNWSKGFYQGYKAKLDTFWKDHRLDYRAQLKAQFIADARNQLKQGSDTFTLADYNLVMRATSDLAGRKEIAPDTPLTMADLQAQGPAKGGAHRFDIYNYQGDILHFCDLSTPASRMRQILYLPGAQPPFVTFRHFWMMHRWVSEQAQDPKTCAALAAHFSLYDRQDGARILGTSGVDSALKGLARDTGAWPPKTYVNMRDLVISDDVFTQMVGYIRERHASDADTLIKSNGELNKDLWIADIEAGERVLLPLAPLGGPIALASALAGTALVGLGTDKAINGDTQAERRQGARVALEGTLDVLFSAGAAPDRPVRDPFEAQGLPAESLAGDWPTATAAAPLDAYQPYQVPLARIVGLTPNARGIYRDPAGAFFIGTNDGSVFQIKGDFKVSDNQVQLLNPQTRNETGIFLQADDQGAWQRVQLQGGGGGLGKLNPPSPGPLNPWQVFPGRGFPNTLGTDFAHYEVPQNFRADIEREALESRGLNSSYSAMGERKAAVSDFFIRQRQLLTDATAYFNTRPIFQRPPVPAIPTDAKPSLIIEAIYKNTNGMVIGESHSALASKQFLIDNMKTFKKEGVKTLYMEHLQSDLHQTDLNSYFDTGEMPERLKKFLISQDAGHKTDPQGIYTFMNVLIAARKNKIQVVAIDASTSYYMKGVDKGTNRQQMMNYYASKIINSDQQPPHKWVALLGNSHSNAYEGVPGLAELQGGIGIRIKDGTAGEPDRIEYDPGENMRPSLRNTKENQVKSDFLLTVGPPPERGLR